MKPKDIPVQPQHQGSLTDQLRELADWADRLGLYDAADHLRRKVNAPSRF